MLYNAGCLIGESLPLRFCAVSGLFWLFCYKYCYNFTPNQYLMARRKKPIQLPKNENPSPLHYAIRWKQSTNDEFRKFLRRMIAQEEKDLNDTEAEYQKRRDEMFKRHAWCRNRINEVWAEINKPLQSGTVEDHLWKEYRDLIEEIGYASYGNDPWMIRTEELYHAMRFLSYMEMVETKALGEIPWVSLN